MPTFAYQARDDKGATRKGVLDANDQASATTALSQKGLVVVSITESTQVQRRQGGARGAKIGKIPEADLVMFTRMLATMIDAGLPIVQSLSALAEQTTNKNFKPVLVQLTATIEMGEQLSSSLAKYPTVFDRLFVNMVRAGESGGALAEILDRLAAYLEASAKLKKKVKSSMSYPVIVMSIALLIVIFLMIKVIPAFANIYKEMGASDKLPAPTKMLIAISENMASIWGLLTGVVIVVGIVVFLKYIKTEKGRKKWDIAKMKFPVFGPLMQKISVSRFARTFAQLIRSGVPIIETLNIVASSSGNWLIEVATMDAVKAIEKGEGISTSLAKHPIFPPMIIRMITAGESTGKVDVMLTKIADFYDSEIDSMLSGLTSLIEPMLIGFLGIVVGFIVLAMFMPMFKLTEMIK